MHDISFFFNKVKEKSKNKCYILQKQPDGVSISRWLIAWLSLLNL